MALPGSGQISMSGVNVELTLSATAQITLNDTAVRTMAGVPSGQISLDSLHGKAYCRTFSIDSVLLGGSCTPGYAIDITWTTCAGSGGAYLLDGQGSPFSYTTGGCVRNNSVVINNAACDVGQPIGTNLTYGAQC